MNDVKALKNFTALTACCLAMFACSDSDSKPLSFQQRFEAVYGYTDCKDVTIGTTLADQIWVIIYHTFHAGQFDITESSYLDEECKTSLTTTNRFGSFEILPSSNEESGEIRLAIKTQRILSSVNEKIKPGEPVIACNREEADDFKKEECVNILTNERYVTAKLTTDGYQPFKDIDSAGTTEETISIELAPYTLKVLDAND